MKKKFLISLVMIFSLILIILLAIVGKKISLINFYKIDNINESEYDKYVKYMRSKEIINIKHEEVKNNNYIEYNGIQLKNGFKNFKKADDFGDNLKYDLLRDNEIVASFLVGSFKDSVTTMLKKDGDVYSLSGEKKMNLTKNDRIKILNQNNIQNDVDLIKYLAKQNVSEKKSFFYSEEEIKEKYFIQFLTSLEFIIGDKITFIEGDYTGYIITMNTIKDVYLFDKGKKYIFTFVGDHFTLEKIIDIIKTVNFK